MDSFHNRLLVRHAGVSSAPMLFLVPCVSHGKINFYNGRKIITSKRQLLIKVWMFRCGVAAQNL
jgi:hypothetical protein